MSKWQCAMEESGLLLEIRQLAHLTEPDTSLRELVLELEDLNL